MNLRRPLRFGALALVAALGLTACQSKVGLAVSVNNERLTDSQLSTYVQPGAAPYTVTGSDGSPLTIVPRQYAVESWTQLALVDRAIAAHGGPRTAAETAAARTAVLGSHTIEETEKAVSQQGFTAELGDLLIDREVAFVVLVQRLQKGITPQQALSVLSTSQANNAILAAVNGTHPVVDVSPRYGTWDPTRLALSADPDAGLPSFVIGSTGAPSAAVPGA